MMPQQDILDPGHYEKTRLPLLEAETLPAACYTSEAFYRREVEGIFRKVWNFIGRAERVADPGDYFAFEFAGIPVVVVRGKDRRVRAFANSCRHRGAKVMSGEGNCPAMCCPYHAWTYGLDGKLKTAPEMDRAEGFDRKDYGLVELRLETWGGFLFLNFDPQAESLESFLGDLPELMRPYAFERMRCTRRKEYLIDCNWKVYVENAMESYHVPRVHTKTLQRQKRDHNPPILPARGQYCGLYTRHKGSRALLEGMKGFPDIATLEGDSAAGTYYILVYPSTMFGCTYDCMWWLELQPLGPARSRLIVGSCFPEETVARDDFDELVGNYYRRWEISIGEDNEVSELQQAGLSSPFCQPGRFSHMEPLVHAIDNWVLDRTVGAQGS
jgi:phenylpropionate dioxygenase-like ring-hydroxylating dioxygenase large terminal subunit